MFTSRMFAPPRTWSSATSTAVEKSPFLISRANFADPVTFVRSPAIWKLLSGRMVSGSSPLNCVGRGSSGTARTGAPLTASAMEAMWSGVVPQQPPTMFSRPAAANSRRMSAVAAGCSSYSPKAFGKPAFG